MARFGRQKQRLAEAANGRSRWTERPLSSPHPFVTVALLVVALFQQSQFLGQIALAKTINGGGQKAVESSSKTTVAGGGFEDDSTVTPPATASAATTDPEIALAKPTTGGSLKEVESSSKPPPSTATQPETITAPATASTATSKNWWEKPQPLLLDWPDLPVRNDIHQYLELLKLKRGAEVGVQKGLLARKTLKTWKSCEEYVLIDLWGNEAGYIEPGPDTNAYKQAHLSNARRILKPYENITHFYVMRSTDAAKKLKKGSFDYVYIDARHDYCAVAEDIEHYWPTLRPGGIMAGHDFVDAQYAIDRLGPVEDWSKCEDGSHQPRAVRGAVEDFAKEHNLNIKTTQEGFPTWLIQKPY
ncbi:expressed unknown protein [Seminavis robusta]|uniref:Methyltransferase n=1 Tax=Seminavis robusta TaxID=568900 RepID=A0A9N8H4J8_9STRA|nr:expressed unknown protein [Seminavis robusta]|eukprot:Sro85_g045510.1 n/a (358) ;mRNA; r:112575-113729